MATAANTQIAAAVTKPADQVVRVQCVTCHRGSAIPQNPPPPAPPGGGPGAAPPGGANPGRAN